MDKLQFVKVHICALFLKIDFDDCQVLALYLKSGGWNGAHGLVLESANIAAISYLVIQSFEHFAGQQFHMIPQALQSFQAKQFAHLPLFCFLCTLNHVLDSVNSDIKLSASDYKRFKSLNSNEVWPLIIEVIKWMWTHKKVGAESDMETL